MEVGTKIGGTPTLGNDAVGKVGATRLGLLFNGLVVLIGLVVGI